MSTTDYHNSGVPAHLLAMVEELNAKNPDVPDEPNGDVAIFGQAEDDPVEDVYNSAVMVDDTPVERTQQETASALLDNNAVNSAPTNAAQRPTPMTHYVPQHIRTTASNSSLSNTAAELQTPMIHSVPQQIVWTGNSTVSNTSAQLEILMTNSCTQQIRTTSTSKVGHKIIMPPLQRNHNPQQTIQGYVHQGLVDSNTWLPVGPAQLQSEQHMAASQPQVAAAAFSAFSSNGGKVQRTKRTKLHEQSTQCADKTLKARIIKAKYLYERREKEKRDMKALHEKCSRQEKELSLKDQELVAARQEISRKEQENQNMSKKNQELLAWNQWLYKTVQQFQQQFGLANQENNG